jgi:hypothetical protein
MSNRYNTDLAYRLSGGFAAARRRAAAHVRHAAAIASSSRAASIEWEFMTRCM